MEYDSQMDFGATGLADFRLGLSSWRRITLIGLAIFSLTVSLATRFTISASETPAARSVQAHSPDAHRQNLLGDGIRWTAPASSFTVFEPPRALVYAVPADLPFTSFWSENWLYNRPPPSC